MGKVIVVHVRVTKMQSNQIVPLHGKAGREATRNKGYIAQQDVPKIKEHQRNKNFSRKSLKFNRPWQ